MNTKHIVILIGVATLSCAIGFGVTNYLLAPSHSVSSNQSITAQYAMKYCTQKALKNKVFQMDKAFVNQYRLLCNQLCQNRSHLTGTLKTVSSQDPMVQQRIEESHQIMVRMEKLTLDHMLKIRDILTEEKGAAFIEDIQSELEKGHKSLQLASGCCSTESECKGSETK